ncbi:hypothetical protein H6503_06770 [Candidatus Woesearchaeota archaeon]|nr:hypothetical protein [Candidatus Woesearchaeota archaeon]
MRKIAIIDYDVIKPEIEMMFEALDRYKEFMTNLNLTVSFNHVGNVSDLELTFEPETNGDGSFYDHVVSGIAYETKFFNTNRPLVEGYTDIMLLVPNVLRDYNPKDWHTKKRNGEAYGFQNNYNVNGGTIILTTAPTRDLSGKLEDKHLDYIIRHEFGHLFIPAHDLPEDAEDNIMKPIVESNPEYLTRKNIDYNPEQIKSMQETLAKWNSNTMNISCWDP